MRRLLCDALIGVWMAVTTPVRRLVADAVHDALERERSWTECDDAAVDAYSQEPE